MNEAILNVVPAQTPEKPIRPFPGIWASIGWIVLFFALQAIAGVAVVIAVLAQKQAAGENVTQLPADKMMEAVGGLPIIWSLIASGVLTLFLLWLYLRRKNRSAAIHLDRWSQLSAKQTVLLAVICMGAGLGFNFLYESYVIPDIKIQDQLHKLFESIPQTALNRATLFAAVALLAPLTEELLFRGLLQKSLSNRMPPSAAILIAAAIFGAIHRDFYAFPALFVMGGVFGYLYYRTGSLRVNIALHMVNNGAALILSWVFPG